MQQPQSSLPRWLQLAVLAVISAFIAGLEIAARGQDACLAALEGAEQAAPPAASGSVAILILVLLSLMVASGLIAGLHARVKKVSQARQEVEEKNRLLEREVKEREQAEKALQASEASYRLLVSQIPAMVFTGYGDWSIDPLDEKVEALTGYSREDFLSRRVKWCDLIPPDDLNFAAGAFIEALKTDRSYVREHRLRRRDGEIIWVQCRGQIFCDAQGKVDYISGVSFDVTARRRAEEALRESEQRFRDISENAREWIWEVDLEGKYTYASGVVEKLLGYRLEEILERHFYNLFHPEDRESLKEAAFAVFAAQQPFREFLHRNVHKNGDVVWMVTNGVPFLDAQGNLLGYRGSDIDVTARRRAEEALQQSERFLANIINCIQDGISILDLEYNILQVNPAMEKGYAHAMPLIGKKCYKAYHGRSQPCEVCPTRRTLKTGKAAREEIWEKNPDLGTVKYIELCTFPFIDLPHGNLIGVVECVRDITEQRQAEEALHQSEEQLRQAVKMEAVGRLAGGVAHDFNNILTAITGYADLLLLNPDLHDPLSRDIKEIRRAADRAASLTRQLLAFSRKQILQPQSLDLNRVVANLDQMLRRIIGEDIDLATALAPDLGAVRADPSQIEQVIMNLVVNARDAMPQGGKLTLETANVDLDDDYAQEHLEAQPGPYVLLAVSDTGVGLNQEARARIFEPFFTTKKLGQGTGLGLSTVYGIIKQSGGLIWVYSEPGKGTTFKIYLPRLDVIQDSAALKQGPLKCEWGSETILLVEDEDMVRQVARRILARHGYTVLEAASGSAALAASREHDGPIHLLLTDVVMPGMSGQEIAENLRRQRQDMKVLFMSGHTENAIVHHGVLDPGTAFIQKPFKHDVLVGKVREVLDGCCQLS